MLVSPSTESWSHVRAAAPRSMPWSVAGSVAASVRMTASIVAIRGWIIPTPFAMPDTVTSTSDPSAAGSASRTDAHFGRESVVMRARAAATSASSPVESSPGMRAAIAAATRSTGRRVPMTPVEKASVRPTAVPSAAARLPARWSWSASPAAPVAAFAEPEVERIASAQPDPAGPSPPVSARWARVSRTGAAANALRVKTPAAAAGPPVVAITAKSGRPDRLIPIGTPRARKPAGITARSSADGRSTVSGASGASSAAAGPGAGPAPGSLEVPAPGALAVPDRFAAPAAGAGSAVTPLTGRARAVRARPSRGARGRG